MLGKYDVMVKKDGRFKIPKVWREEIQSEWYNIYKAKEPSQFGETVLIYSFDDIDDSNYELIISYVVAAYGVFFVPTDYREKMHGECTIVGLMDHFSLHIKSEYEKAFAKKEQDIAKLLDELGF